MQEIQYTPIISSRVNQPKKVQTHSNRQLERTPGRDSVEIRNARKKNRDKKNQMRGFIAGVTLAMTLMGGTKAAVNQITAPQENFDAQGRTVAEAADFCDVDSRAIMLANDIADENETINEIILPEKYSVLDEEISKIEERIESASGSELEELEEKLAELKERKSIQDELAQVYVVEDGKYAYIIPNESGINSEELKDAFGIDDGVLRKYNDLSYDWGVDTNVEVHQGYKDYTNSTIPKEGVKVPQEELE